MKILSWPKEDRPREKLWAKGEQALSNSELLAILLRTGTKGESAVALSQRILEKFKTFRQMSHTDTRDWVEFKGLGQAKLAQLKAALEIGRRFREDEMRAPAVQIKGAREVAEVLLARMRDYKIEVFTVVYLNAQNRIIKIEDVTRGTVNQANPIVREILHQALQAFAVAIICAHNHPSGLAEPSFQDRAFTQKLKEAGELLNVRLLDHLILGDGNFFSFAEKGML